MSKKVRKKKRNVRNKKEQEQRKKRLLGLFFIISITLLLLVGGTYAWFVGLGLVQVNAFDLEVTSGNQLEISLDAITWSDSVTISNDTYDIATYPGHSNHPVGDDGLQPVSTVGDIDEDTSRLKLFAKASMTSTKGGFRLVTAQIPNETEEVDGYFVFDLFIRNGKDPDYVEDYNYLDDEDIYMIKSTDSQAIGAPSGGGDDYGIANSIRVALMQIGRIKSQGYSASIAQGITCEDDEGDGITGLCNKGDSADATDTGNAKTWNIWEPNDKKHNEMIIDRFNTICKKRTESGGVVSYTTDACDEIAEDTALTTYCVNQEISSDMGVDIYDGINGYDTFNPATHGLTGVNTLTDTEINTTDNSTRQQVFKLAANSITKIRVYMYLEGQDVDNYDMIYKGEKIKIKFGFTRDRYEMENN